MAGCPGWGSSHSLQTSPFGLVFEAGLSLEEQGGHLQIDVREKANVKTVCSTL